MTDQSNTEQDVQKRLEARICDLEQRVRSLEDDCKDKKKLTVSEFEELWNKYPKALAQHALTKKGGRMRHPRFVLETKLLRITFWMMIATFTMVVATLIMAAVTFFRP